MTDTAGFDYYYGDESEQFSFCRIPRQLVTGEAFRRLSTDAKLLYGLLLDRMGLSAKNGWYDEQGRVFIYYTLEKIQSDLCCGHEKAVKLLAELDTGKGFGLIERKKQGQGKPTRIYAKRFTTRTVPPQPLAPQPVPRLPIFGKSDASYTESNQTDLSQLNPSIHPSVSPLASLSLPPGLMDGYDCREEMLERIEYDALCRQYSRDDVDEVVELLTRIRTNNAIERLNREIRRRTRVVGAFPDGNSALMLVCARLRHVAGTQWGNKKYMNMKHLEALCDDASFAG